VSVPEMITQVVCYTVHTGDGSGSYEECLVYNEWAEAVADIKAALDHDRDVLIERTCMTQTEYDSLDDTSDDAARRLRGETVKW